MELNISLEWNWIKNHFPLTILIVNRTLCPGRSCRGGRAVLWSEIHRGVLQTEVLKVPELPDGTQVSLQWWIFLRGPRLGPGSAVQIIQLWQPQQTRPLPDLTTQIEGQERIMRTHCTEIIIPWLPWCRSYNWPDKPFTPGGGGYDDLYSGEFNWYWFPDSRNKGKSTDNWYPLIIISFCFHNIPDYTMDLSPGHPIEVGPLFLVLGHKISTVDGSHICWMK